MSLTGAFLRIINKIPKTPIEVVFSIKSKLLHLNHNYILKFYMEKIIVIELDLIFFIIKRSINI